MKYRALGTTELNVSEIGFGAWGLGGDSYGPVEDKVSRKALHTAFDMGINFYDTADVYGAGRSERVLGKTMKKVRGKIIIATKVGTLPHKGFYMPQNFSRKYISQSLENSLRRLRTDYIDLYQLHSPQKLAELQKHNVINTLEDLKRKGLIREYGISAKSPLDAKNAIQKYKFRVVQVNFNLIDQRAIDDGLFPLCEKLGIGVIARTPLCFGYLTGKLKGNETWKANDHRANWPQKQLKRWAQAPGLFNRVMQKKAPSQFAIQFCLTQRAVCTTIPGMLTPEQVKENCRATELSPLSGAETAEIKKIYHSRSFYDPKIKASRQSDPK